MAEVFQVHPDNPQPRSIKMAIDSMKGGGLIVYPTDSGYAIGWGLDNHQALKKVALIKAVEEHQNYTMMCDSISQMTDFVLVDNIAFRLIKQHSPGPYTFILPATRKVPKKMQHQKRRTIGVRISGHNVVQALLAELGEPMMTSSLEFPDVEMYTLDIDDVVAKIGNQVDVIIDVGYCAQDPSTVIDLSEGEVTVLRKGAGEIDFV